MAYPLQLQTYSLGLQMLSLYVPEAGAVHRYYQQHKTTQTSFPYWAQVWPAALALGQFLLQQPHYIQSKKVLELAAGLGLPSLVAAQFADEVTCTDYIPEAVAAATASAQYNSLPNMQCTVMNWHHLPPDLKPNVLLLSDVNYEPHQFEVLYKILERFIANGTTVLLSTPQRLMAKPFISRLLPWCAAQHQLEVSHLQHKTSITVMVLQST